VDGLNETLLSIHYLNYLIDEQCIICKRK